MNILLINHYAGSPKTGMEFRPYYLGKEWVKKGHCVYIVGGSYSHLRKQQPKVNKDFTIENIDGIHYIWLKTPNYASSGMKRFFSMLVFIFKLFKYKRRLIKETNPDVVIASSTYPVDIYPAYAIAKKNKAKLCFELHDLWPLSPMEIGGYSKWHPFIMLMQAGENYACKHSDVIVSLLGNAQEHLVKHGMAPNKFHHVINGFDFDEWKNDREDIPSEHKQLLSNLSKNGKIIVGYAGGINPSNSMKTLMSAAKLLEDKSNIAFVCVGNGNDLDGLKDYVKKHNLENFFFLPPIGKKSIPTLLSNFDIAYMGGAKCSFHKYGISPNKVTDYMLAGKPIILAMDIKNSSVEIIGCGVSVAAENQEEVKNAILKLSNMSKEDREVMGNKGKEYALKELTYEKLALKFIDALK